MSHSSAVLILCCLASAVCSAQERGGAREWRLRLSDGARFHDVYQQLDPSGRRHCDLLIRLVERGADWGAVAIDSPTGRLAERLYLARVAAIELQGSAADGGAGLTGRMILEIGRQGQGNEIGRGENAHSMQKAGRQPALDWSIGGRQRVLPRSATFELDVDPQPGRRYLRLTVEALAGDRRAAQPPAADDRRQVRHEDIEALLGKQRQPVELELDHDREGWLPRRAVSPGWNRALHAIDADGLQLSDARLQGSLVITLQPDPWVPTPREPRRLVLRCDLPIVAGRVDGSVAVSGDQGAFTTRLHGDVWRVASGTYRYEGIDGRWSDAAVALWRPVPRPETGILLPAAEAALPDLRQAYRAAALSLRDRWQPAREPTRDPIAEQELPPLADSADPASYSEGLRRQLISASSVEKAPQIGSAELDDPAFAPAAGAEPVAGGRLPEWSDRAGPATWQQLVDWRVVGPFVDQGRLGHHGPALPAVVPGAGPYLDERLRLGRRVEELLDWHPTTTATVYPPSEDWHRVWVHDGKMSSYSTHPAEKLYRAKEASGRHLVWYGSSRLQVPAGRWMFAIQVVRQGSLWIDGRLVWESAADHDPWAPVVVPVELAAGSHELCVRVAMPHIGYQPPPPSKRSRFQLWVCTAGGPQSATDLAMQEADRAARLAEDDGIAGWHAPGGRRFPTAQPPLAWDVASGANVRWSLAADGFGQAVLADDLLLVPCEPHHLQAIDLETGERRWQLSADLLERSDGIPSAPGDLDRLRQDLALGAARLRQAAAARGAAEDREAGRATYDQAVAEVQARLRPWQSLAEWLAERGLPVDCRADSADELRWPSTAGAAVAVAGERIYARFGTGTLMACSRAGEQVWQRSDGPVGRLSPYASPLVVGDLLVLDATIPDQRGDDRQRWVIAYATDDGSERWRVQVDGEEHGLVAMRAVGPSSSRRLLITAEGTVLDATDGTLLAEEIFPFGAGGHERPLPVIDGDRLYFTSGQGECAFRLALDGTGALRLTKLWEFRRSGNSGNLPVVDHGLLFVPRIADEFHSHHPVPWDQLDVYDAAGGHHLAKPKPVLRDCTAPLPVVVAGDYLLFGDRGTGRFGIKEERRFGRMALLSNGDQPRVVARSSWPDGFLQSVPLASDECIIVTAADRLWCFAADNEAGELYEEQARALAVLEGLGPKPSVPPIAEPEPLPVPQPRAVQRRSTLLRHGVAPWPWLVAGPYSKDLATIEQLPQGPGGVVDLGQELHDGDQLYPFHALSVEQTHVRGLSRIYEDDGMYYLRNHSFDIRALTGDQSHQAVLASALVLVDEPGVWRFDMASRGATCWIAGIEIAHQQHLRLRPGIYPVLVRITVDKLPPFGRPTVTPLFMRTRDPIAAVAAWRDEILTIRPQLERIIAKLPDSAEAIYARRYLEQLDDSTAAAR